MNKNIFAVFFSFIIIAFGFSFVVPYPIKNNTLLTAKQQQLINDYNEDENMVENSEQKPYVYNLDWFEDMNTIFKKYVTITIIDIYSKTEIKVQRLGGYNHADIQTIDANNTEKLKKIYGGQWSWTRRPVWVCLDGKYYAGSINGMPHGFDVLQVGEGGHTCVHFLNSKTHGTKRVDPDHQKCVQYAYEHQDLLHKYLKGK